MHMAESALEADVAHIRGPVACGSGRVLLYEGSSPVIILTCRCDNDRYAR
jgi:hypothetical protein